MSIDIDENLFVLKLFYCYQMCKRKRQYDSCTFTSSHSASSITQGRRADEIPECWQTSFTLLTAETSGFVINMKGKNNRVDGMLNIELYGLLSFQLIGCKPGKIRYNQ